MPKGVTKGKVVPSKQPAEDEEDSDAATPVKTPAGARAFGAILHKAMKRRREREAAKGAKKS
jgi:hypothetical protein